MRYKTIKNVIIKMPLRLIIINLVISGRKINRKIARIIPPAISNILLAAFLFLAFTHGHDISPVKCLEP